MTIPTISALPTPPSRSDAPDVFIALADAFIAALPTFRAEANAFAEAVIAAASSTNYNATSSSSVTIGTGSKSFAATPGALLQIGQWVLVASTASPANYMIGQVTAYNATTGALTVNVTVTGGSGTLASWTISLAVDPAAGWVRASDGTASDPGMAFAGDADTGFYRPGANRLGIVTGGVQRGEFDASGNFGLGTTPTKRLTIAGDARIVTGGGRFDAYSSTGDRYYYLRGSDTADVGVLGARGGGDTTNVDVIHWNSTGSVGIGTATPGQKLDVAGSVILVSPNSGTTGGLIIRDAPGNPGAAIIQFVNNAASSQYGYLKALNGIISSGAVLAPDADNTYTIGRASFRWSQLHATTSTIATSDEREKLWITVGEDRRAQDLRIATAILDELGHFQFLGSIEEKGEDGARWHFGARAQRVWAIVAAEGLCAPLVGEGAEQRPDPAWTGPPPPAWLCWDIWPDRFEPVMEEQQVDTETVIVGQEETGLLDAGGQPIMRDVTEERPVMGWVEVGQKQVETAGNRFGLRIEQMNLLLSWALHQRLTMQEAA